MDLVDYIDGKYTFGTQTPITVGAADAVLIPQGNHRLSILVFNNSANTIFMSFGTVASATAGFKIPVGGSPVQFDRKNFGNLLDADLHFVATAGSTAAVIVISYLKLPSRGTGGLISA